MDKKSAVHFLRNASAFHWALFITISAVSGAIFLSHHYSGRIVHPKQSSAEKTTQGERLMNEAVMAQLSGRFPEAITAYEKILQIEPANAEAYFRLGAIYFHLGLPTRSEQYYRKAIDCKYQNPEIYFHLGYIKENAGNFQEALEWYLKAEERGVGSAELYYNIGNVFARMDNREKALAYYLRAVSVKPEHVDAFINLSIVSFQAGSYADAQFYLEKAESLGYHAPQEYREALAGNSAH